MPSPTPSRLVVREARPEEHPELARFAVARVPQPLTLPMDEKDCLEYFNRPDVDVFVAEVGGRRAGMVVASEDRGLFSSRMHVSALLTEREFRSSSVASRLIRRVLDHAVERNSSAFSFESHPAMAQKYLRHVASRFSQSRIRLDQTHSLPGGSGSFQIRLPFSLWRSLLYLLKRPGSK